uniref:CUB domain-containing protein n=1 Tax=Panagrolaimus sp. ES5 TaxID=591445 RepID=A0AC34FVF9_9BILA
MASVCIQLKKDEFKFLIIGDTKNSTHDIPTTIKDNDPFTIKQIAISDTHISLLLISHETAYRMEFFIEELNEVNNFELEYIGSANSIAWHPLADSDVYMEMNGTGIKKTTQCLHRKKVAMKNLNINIHFKLQENYYFDSEAAANKTSYKPCLKWTEIKAALPSTTTTIKTSPDILPKTLPQTSAGISISHLVVAGIIIVALAILFVIYKAMKWENHDSRNSMNSSVGFNSQRQAIALIQEPEDAAPTIAIQSPPSYHTHDIVRTIEQMRAEIRNLNRSLSQQNNTANSRSHMPDVLESSNPLISDPLVDSKM